MREEDLTPRIQILSKSLLLAFALIAAVLLFWSVLRANAILDRDDNPRLVEAELQIRRGQIVDRNGRMLAQTIDDGANLQRLYPSAAAGPAVGYYSFRHGTGGVEESYDAALRGDLISDLERAWQRLLHQPPQGQNLRLTLDAAWQQQADALMAAEQGALILLELSGDNTAAVRALVSHPAYDPNFLDEQFPLLIDDENAPLLNRVTQSQYQPGRTLLPFLIAAALDRDLVRFEDTVPNPNRPIPVNGVGIRCTQPPPDPATWQDVLAYHCPGPLQALAEEMGISGLDQAFASFGLTLEPALPLVVAPAASDQISNQELAAIGQENLTVTPLQVGLALASLGNSGRLPTPRLVTDVQNPGGAWVPVIVGDEAGAAGETAVSPLVASRIRSALAQTGDLREYRVTVLSGPAANTNAWYLALAPAASPRYALVIVLENQVDVENATAVGRELLGLIGE